MWAKFCEPYEENVKENVLVFPAIYKHFKGKYYATMGVAECKEVPPYELSKGYMKATHTETGKRLTIGKTKDNDYIISNLGGEFSRKRYVLYKSLYDDTGIYAREVDMFLSKVDREKYPETKQEFRFELFRF